VVGIFNLLFLMTIIQVSKITSPHQLKTYAQMISEAEGLQHVNDIMSAIFIFVAKMIQDIYFNKCLMMKSLFIPEKKSFKIT